MIGRLEYDTHKASVDRGAGFTIIELLVSLTILALILSFLPGTLRMGQRVWETDETFEQRAALSAFQRYVEQRLAEAMPIYWRDGARGLRIEFEGESGRIVFVAPAEAGPAGGGVYRFELRQEDGAGPARPLILRQTLYRGRANGLAGREEETDPSSAVEHRTAGRIAVLTIRYFGSIEGQKNPEWQTRWPLADRLPELVEITFAGHDRISEFRRSVVALHLRPPR